MKKLILVLVAMLLLVGCSSKGKTDLDAEPEKGLDTTSEAETKEVGFSFKNNDVTINMNVPAKETIDALGEPMDYFEAASCAFQGLDKIYYYSGFELSTYPNKDVDYISSVTFSDDSVSTIEGICLGSKLEDVLAAYGDDYKEELGLYTYTLGKTNLTFLIEDNLVASVNYLAVLE